MELFWSPTPPRDILIGKLKISWKSQNECFSEEFHYLFETQLVGVLVKKKVPPNFDFSWSIRKRFLRKTGRHAPEGWVDLICRANEYLRVCPPPVTSSWPPVTSFCPPPSPHRDLRICSLHAIGWCQEFSKVSKRTHLHRKTHENASNKCNIDAFWCSFCSLLTGRGSSPGQPSAQIQMVPRWLRTGFGVSSASNTI